MNQKTDIVPTQVTARAKSHSHKERTARKRQGSAAAGGGARRRARLYERKGNCDVLFPVGQSELLSLPAPKVSSASPVQHSSTLDTLVVLPIPKPQSPSAPPPDDCSLLEAMLLEQCEGVVVLPVSPSASLAMLCENKTIVGILPDASLAGADFFGEFNVIHAGRIFPTSSSLLHHIESISHKVHCHSRPTLVIASADARDEHQMECVEPDPEHYDAVWSALVFDLVMHSFDGDRRRLVDCAADTLSFPTGDPTFGADMRITATLLADVASALAQQSVPAKRSEDGFAALAAFCSILNSQHFTTNALGGGAF